MDLDLPPEYIAAAHDCTCTGRHSTIPGPCAYTSHADHPPNLTYYSPPTHHYLHPGTLVLRPSAAAYARLLQTLDLDSGSSIRNEQDLLERAYRGRWQQLEYTYNATQTMRLGHPSLWDVRRVRVMNSDRSGAPWTSSQREGYEVERWWREFREVREEWTGNGHAGGVAERRWLWETVIAPLVRRSRSRG
jgi:hypothetical protein